jgi:hypothetical protein
MKTALALLFALVVVDQARAQTAQATPAADITNTEIEAAVQKTAALPVSDQQLRMVNIKGEYNVGAASIGQKRPARSSGALWRTARLRRSTTSFQGTGRS